MVVGDSSMGNEEKLKCSGIGSWEFESSVWMFGIGGFSVEACCAGDFCCRVFCWKVRVLKWVCVVKCYKGVETVERFWCLVPSITGFLSGKYRSLNRVKFVQDIRNTVSRDGGLSLLYVVVAARVFEALRILTETAVFFTGLKRARILSINFTQTDDNPPC